jgi:hypothetical protein
MKKHGNNVIFFIHDSFGKEKWIIEASKVVNVKVESYMFENSYIPDSIMLMKLIIF